MDFDAHAMREHGVYISEPSTDSDSAPEDFDDEYYTHEPPVEPLENNPVILCEPFQLVKSKKKRQKPKAFKGAKLLISNVTKVTTRKFGKNHSKPSTKNTKLSDVPQVTKTKPVAGKLHTKFSVNSIGSIGKTSVKLPASSIIKNGAKNSNSDYDEFLSLNQATVAISNNLFEKSPETFKTPCQTSKAYEMLDFLNFQSCVSQRSLPDDISSFDYRSDDLLSIAESCVLPQGNDSTQRRRKSRRCGKTKKAESPPTLKQLSITPVNSQQTSTGKQAAINTDKSVSQRKSLQDVLSKSGSVSSCKKQTINFTNTHSNVAKSEPISTTKQDQYTGHGRVPFQINKKDPVAYVQSINLFQRNNSPEEPCSSFGLQQLSYSSLNQNAANSKGCKGRNAIAKQDIKIDNLHSNTGTSQLLISQPDIFFTKPCTSTKHLPQNQTKFEKPLPNVTKKRKEKNKDGDIQTLMKISDVSIHDQRNLPSKTRYRQNLQTPSPSSNGGKIPSLMELNVAVAKPNSSKKPKKVARAIQAGCSYKHLRTVETQTDDWKEMLNSLPEVPLQNWERTSGFDKFLFEYIKHNYNTFNSYK